MTHIYSVLSGRYNHGSKFEYSPSGMIDGHTTSGDSIVCGICGDIATQPYPTGLYTHDRADMPIISDHQIRSADLLESLLLLNNDENHRSSSGSWEYYESVDGNLYGVNRNHTECLIHRKYWCMHKNLDYFRNRLIGSIVDDRKNDGHYRYIKQSEINSLKDRVSGFFHKSERHNVRQFEKFLIKRNSVLKSNPPNPITKLRFHLVKGRGISHIEQILLSTVRDTDLELLPIENEVYVLDGKKYIVTNILAKVFDNTASDTFIDVYMVIFTNDKIVKLKKK